MDSSALISLFTRAENRQFCTQVTAECPISNTIYGYRPSLAWNALFLAIFALSTICHGIQGVYYRMWTFLITMVVGGACEAVGEIGRLMMHNNPYSDPGFKLQIVLLTFAPAFLAAGIYLTLKHLVITFGSSFSRLKPNYYTWLFISCDIFSIVLQGAGGGIASAATSDQKSLLEAGDDLMIAGLAFQVFTLLIFGVLATDYAIKVWKHKDELNPATVNLRRSLKFKAFLVALTLAYVVILIRCVYRVAELSGGWGNSIMKQQGLFTGLDSFMIAIAMIALNLFHPGMAFQNRRKANYGKATDDFSNNNTATVMEERK